MPPLAARCARVDALCADRRRTWQDLWRSGGKDSLLSSLTLTSFQLGVEFILAEFGSLEVKRLFAHMEDACSVYCTLVEQFSLCGCRAENTRKVLFETLDLLFCLFWTGKAVKYLKWYTCWFPAVLKSQNELPNRPPWISDDHKGPLRGGFRTFANIRLRESVRSEGKYGLLLTLAESIAGSKRSFPGVSGEYVRNDVLSTFLALTDQKKTERADLVGVEIPLKRIIREVFHKAELPNFSLAVPSTNANYEYGRDALGTLLPVCELGYGDCDPMVCYRSMVPKMSRLTAWYRDEVMCRKWSVYDCIEPEALHLLSFLDGLISCAWYEIPRVKLIGLKEPLKCRTISAGPPLTYYLLGSIQRHLWSTMAKHRVFRYTAEPVGGSLIDDLGPLHEGNTWISADYSAATNNIDSRATEICWKEYCLVCKLPYYIEELGLRALTRHVICDPRDKSMSTFMNQTDGQLMGSVISFPFLCFINCAMMRHFLESTTGRSVIPLSELRILVNGDDLAGQIREEDYGYWKDVMGSVGLTPSPGKNHLSKRFVTINTVTYQYCDHWWRGPEMDRVPVFNSALIRGWRAKGCGGKVGCLDLLPSNATGLSARLEAALFAGGVCNWGPIHDRFYHHHRRLLEKCPPGMSWVLPRSLGGLGLSTVRMHRGLHDRGDRALRVASSYVRLLREDGIPFSCSFLEHQNSPVLKALSEMDDVLVAEDDDMNSEDVIGYDPQQVISSRWPRYACLEFYDMCMESIVDEPDESVYGLLWKKFRRSFAAWFSLFALRSGEVKELSPYEVYMSDTRRRYTLSPPDEKVRIAFPAGIRREGCDDIDLG